MQGLAVACQSSAATSAEEKAAAFKYGNAELQTQITQENGFSNANQKLLRGGGRLCSGVLLLIAALGLMRWEA